MASILSIPYIQTLSAVSVLMARTGWQKYYEEITIINAL